jgi:hypothetical protein
MKKAIRKLNRYIDSTVKRRMAFKAKGPLERLADAEVRHDVLAQEVAMLRAELQMSSVRQQALVDYYESRLDRIYARLSADLASVQGVPIRVEQDSDVDGRLVGELRRVLRVREGYFDIPVAAILSDHLEEGDIRAPLTLQGFRVNRALGSEAGDRVLVGPVVENCSKTALYGPYKKLIPGQYRIALCCMLLEGSIEEANVRFDIFCPTLNEVVGEGRFIGQADSENRFSIILNVDWPAKYAGHELEFRVHQRGQAGFGIIGFDITRVPRSYAAA